MTTTSLHGSSSSLAFVDSKKRMIKTHPVSQLQARGWVVGLSWVQIEADDNDEPTWLVVVVLVRCLKKRMKKPTPSRNCKRGGGFALEGRNPPRLAVACKGVGFCHPMLCCYRQ